ncbi:MAG: glycosyltransferase [Thermodesulfobacteriota bacterium]
MINLYTGIAPQGDLILVKKLCNIFRGKQFLHVNSTLAGGGVAEILVRMVPFLNNLGIDVRWEAIEGDGDFFDMTKKVHNALQGDTEIITDAMWQHHYDINKKNASTMNLEADAVIIHDPQPVPLVEYRKGGVWIWRCHIDISNPMRQVYDKVERYCKLYDASIFSVSKFAKPMDMDEFIIPPSIDPLADKNKDLTAEEIAETLEKFNLPADRKMILQVSRFDRFKDPVGVIEAYRNVKKYNDCILVLAGSPATDDPEADAVLEAVKEAANGDPDIHILMLPPFSNKDINALQRAATVVLQKSLKEGFGLTVSEAMWKGKPVVAGAVGGIPLQIEHGVTGFLVHSVHGAAFRIRQIFNNPEMASRMGEEAKEYVRNNFLITRHIRDYLGAWYSVHNNGRHILEL